ncbi:hypothetical protein, partial [Mycobacterium bouchedurhonense]|uniref:hypothetical protein n=2 Tax=Mycobacterium TaxID=1763 RepID=UPI0036094A0A
ATHAEVDAINELSMALFAEYINRGGTNYDLVSRTLSDVGHSKLGLTLFGGHRVRRLVPSE